MKYRYDDDERYPKRMNVKYAFLGHRSKNSTSVNNLEVVSLFKG